MTIQIDTPAFVRVYNFDELVADKQVDRSDETTESFGTATVTYDDGHVVKFSQDEEGWYAEDGRETPLNRFLSDLL